MKLNKNKWGGAFALAMITGVLLLIGANVTVAQTPTFYQNPTAINGTTYLVGGTNLASPIFMDVRKQGSVSLTSTLRGATTSTNTYSLGWSDDGSTVVTNAAETPASWQVDSVSAVQSTRGTNLATGGHGYLVIWGVNCTQQNTNTVKYTTKISAP